MKANAGLDDMALKEISQLVFQDDRWDTAQKQLRMRNLTREQAMKMLQEGAKMYGFLGEAGKLTRRQKIRLHNWHYCITNASLEISFVWFLPSCGSKN